MDNVLLEKSMAFSLVIIQLCKDIRRDKREYVMSKQLLRSATSIGANIAEAQHAQSRADFYAKFQIALKECSETKYWLALLSGSGYFNDPSVFEQCVEIEKLLVASSNTVKKSLDVS